MRSPILNTTTTRFGTVSYYRAGSPTRAKVLLLHGGGLDSAIVSWEEIIPILASRYDVIAPNFPGYDGSTPFYGPYQIEDLGTWLIEFLDVIGIERCAIIGLSMGGGTALWTAINHPDRVSTLIPVSTYGLAERSPNHFTTYLLSKLPVNAISYWLMRRSPFFFRMALRSIFIHEDRISDELGRTLRARLDQKGMSKVFSNFQRGELTPTKLKTYLKDDLNKIKSPTLFIHGVGDRLVPIEDINEAASKIRGASVVRLKSGHLPVREFPERFKHQVLKFLRLHM